MTTNSDKNSKKWICENNECKKPCKVLYSHKETKRWLCEKCIIKLEKDE